MSNKMTKQTILLFTITVIFSFKSFAGNPKINEVKIDDSINIWTVEDH